MDVTRYFINTFINGKSALPDSDSFTILCKGGKVNVVIGYSSIASNRLTIQIETSVFVKKIIQNYLLVNPIDLDFLKNYYCLQMNKNITIQGLI